MNPGLVIKLRPSGPWRIGPDSGARNRVDVIYHSDSLYSAVTSAMARMGSLEEWLDATARATASAVCFSSCFPFLNDIGFVVPPRTMWPPTSPSLMSASVRWKSARFVPLSVVQAMLAGQPLDKHRWSVDGASACLVPAGKPGPFRTGVRWSAAVDRLSGASERHGTACIEFRPGAGLWTVASFADDAARDRWMGPVKAAFRLLADTGFGGERSRGWGRAEAPEFVEGLLPDMIAAATPELGAEAPEVPEPPAAPEPPVETPEPSSEPEPELAAALEAALAAQEETTPEADTAAEAGPLFPVESGAETQVPVGEADAEPDLTLEASQPAPELIEPFVEPVVEPEPEPEPPSVPEPPATGLHAHWLLSLFAPAPADSVDWARGNYVVMARGGRVESPAGSGELKKQVRMIAEGSVVFAGAAPSGIASDVAPDGFAHPVFRAGFALAIPLPEVR
jgi:CRISPR type III-A-associated RAMP protein Csm4